MIIFTIETVCFAPFKYKSRGGHRPMTNQQSPSLQVICSTFLSSNQPFKVEPYGNGLVNKTFLVTATHNTGERHYILQRISSAFKTPADLMTNLQGIIEWIGGNTQGIIKAKSGLPYYVDADGRYWRMMTYVENSTSFESTENTPELFQSAGKAFGTFAKSLQGFPIDQIVDTIPDFHNTPLRLKALLQALSSDTCSNSMITECREEINFFLGQAKWIEDTYSKIAKTPLCVTHNDTKLNNILFNKDTLEPICVIDLDTVMKGYLAFDFGDAVRFGANTAAEDEPSIWKIGINLDLFRAFASGYIPAASPSPQILDTFVCGTQIITVELGIRFLTDYFSSNIYFRTEYEKHNLVRARSQIALAKDIETKHDKMQKILTDVA